MNNPKPTARGTKEGSQGKYSFAVNFFASLYPVSAEFKNQLMQHTQNDKIKKGNFLVRPGEVCTKVYLLKKGVVRAYVPHGSKEIITFMSCENELVTSISSFFNGTPAKEYIQAVESCEVEYFTAEMLEYFYQNFPETNMLSRLILQQYYQDAEDRAFISKLPSAKEKYTYLSKSKNGRILNRAPLKYIASFLGMRIETLIRLRAALAKEEKRS